MRYILYVFFVLFKLTIFFYSTSLFPGEDHSIHIHNVNVNSGNGWFNINFGDVIIESHTHSPGHSSFTHYLNTQWNNANDLLTFLYSPTLKKWMYATCRACSNTSFPLLGGMGILFLIASSGQKTVLITACAVRLFYLGWLSKDI